jgi:hypothetical protein
LVFAVTRRTGSASTTTSAFDSFSSDASTDADDAPVASSSSPVPAVAFSVSPIGTATDGLFIFSGPSSVAAPSPASTDAESSTDADASASREAAGEYSSSKPAEGCTS